MRFTILAMVLLSACVATGMDDGSSSGSGSAMGSGSGSGSGHHGSMLPADLVGKWTSSGGDAILSYDFSADGGIVYAGRLDTSYSCTFVYQLSYTGYVTLQGNMLTLTPVDGTAVTNECGTVTTAAYSKVEVDAYQIQNGTLYLQDQATGNVLTLTRN